MVTGLVPLYTTVPVCSINCQLEGKVEPSMPPMHHSQELLDGRLGVDVGVEVEMK